MNTNNDHPDLTPKRIRDTFIGEVNQAMRHQVAWHDLSDLFRGKLLAALFHSGYPVDEAIEFCDELTDEIREVIQKMDTDWLAKARRKFDAMRDLPDTDFMDIDGHG